MRFARLLLSGSLLTFGVRSLVHSVEQAILSRQLLRRRQGVLVAVSGGLDSMVLLNVLHTLSARHGWKLVVAHFNHRLRGRSSDADEALARITSSKLGLKFVVGRSDVRKVQRQKKLSLEMTARQLRHEFLASTARKLGIRTIAFAHHADDQVELFFLRLLRGAGGAGLAGMNWHSPSPVKPGIRIVRPFLHETKSALAELAGADKLQYREDASNASFDFLRNRIRHELLPTLEKNYQPALRQTILRVMEILGANADYVDYAAREWRNGNERGDFSELHPAIQRSCLQAALIELGIEPDFELIERLRARDGTLIAVGKGRLIARDETGRIHFHTVAKFPPTPKALKLDFAKPRGCVEFGGATMKWRVCRIRKFERTQKSASEGRELFDADQIGPSIVLRHWLPGDRFQPIGMATGTKLQNLFVNQKIPRAERHRRLVATKADGELFWVEGLRMAENFKLRPGTKRVLEWRWRRIDSQEAQRQR